MMQPEEEYKE